MVLAKGTIHWVLIPLTLGIVTIIPYLIIEQFYLLVLAIIWLIITGFFIIFFRDPKRIPPSNTKFIIAPADGKIISIEQSSNTRENDIIISTFMNIYNVHVNRVPLDGKIINVIHKSGGYRPAFNKDSDENERVIVEMQTKLGAIKIIQIAGLLARRIVPYVTKQEKVKKGQRLGIIRFGSRVDLILPAGKVKVAAKPGQKVQAGITVVAKIRI